MDRNYRDDSIVYKSPINSGRVVNWLILIGIDLMLDEWAVAPRADKRRRCSFGFFAREAMAMAAGLPGSDSAN